MLFDMLRKREISPRLARLRELSLLATLNAGELRHVDVLLHERDYVENEIIFDEGEEGQALYILLEGQVAIVRARAGEEVLLTTLHPGEFFGELALLDRGPRGARAKAASNCRMAVLFREDLASLLSTHAVVASKITMQMARHLAKIIRDSSPSTTLGATAVTL
jgi:CRP-like cAMP-binding protein